jgi:signal transduction histidine kinase
MSLSLRARTRIILAIAAIVPAIAIGGLSIYRASTEVESEVVRGRLAQVRALASSLDETVQGARRSLELAAAWWADERSVDQTRSPESLRVMDRLWRRLHRELPIFESLTILDVNGKTIYGEQLVADAGLGAHSFGGFIGDVSYDEGKPYVPIVSQARSRTGERVGVLVARLDLSFITETIEEVPLGRNARLLVLDGRGTAIARSDRESKQGKSGEEVDHSVAAEALGGADEGEIRHEGTLAIYKNLVAFQSRRAVPWVLILQQPEADAFALARKAARDTGLISLIVLALVLVLGSALASRLTRPLHRIAKRADAIADGSALEGEREPIEAPGEIGLLARRLEEMAIKIGERERLQSALAHEDRLATVGTMAASVAHEINNPLTTILGYSTLLLEDKSEGDADHASLSLMVSEASRMKGIVNGMLEYSRSEPAKERSADVQEVLERVATLLAPSLKKQKVHLQVEVAEAAPRVAAAAQSLQQVFVNLIQNSAQAMPTGGEIRVAVTVSSKSLRVEVVDDGEGISESEREQVFEAFYTTKEPGQGTGLGLAVVKHLVGEFEGQIEVATAPEGNGTCMRLEIPIEAA